MVDHWEGVGRVVFFLIPPMDRFGGEILKFGNPLLDVRSIGVEFFLLGPGVKDAKIGLSITSSASDPLPVAIVQSGVIVDERLGEVLFPPSPVDIEVFDEEGGGNHPHSIGHKAGLVHLSHCRIDDGKSGHSSAPPFKGYFIIRPSELIKLWVEGASENVRGEKSDACEEIPPIERTHPFKAMGDFSIDFTGRADIEF